MTAADIIQAAKDECAAFGVNTPSTNSVYVRRIHARQHQIFALAAQVNPDYYGVCAIGTLEAGSVSTLLLDGQADRPPPAEMIERITIYAPGNSEYVEGDEVHVVAISEVNVAFPPRAHVRDGVIFGVPGDLDGVTSVRIFYSRQPTPVTGTNSVIELSDEHAELLVFDLARAMVGYDLGLSAEDRASILDRLTARETDTLDRYKAHIAGYVLSRESRFGRHGQPT